MKFTKNTILLISISIIFILATLIYHQIHQSNQSAQITPSHNMLYQKTYYKCNTKHNPPTQNILNANNFTRQHTLSSTQQPDLYIPCGYSNAELELFKLQREHVTQTKIFAISGCDILAGKDTLWQTLEKVYSRDGAKLLMPETYLTKSANDLDLCERFYHPENIYILKKNIQRKEGILILDNLMNILATVKRDPRYVIIQHYITNPFLIQKRKLNIRLYIAVVCTLSSGVKAYLYTQGKCIYTNQEYDHNNIANSEAHLTSLNLDAQIYNHLPETFTELQNTIGQVAYNFIWQKIIYKIKQIFFAIQKEKAICQDIKGTLNFQLFGVDVMLDDTLEPWILEFNKGPDMSYKTPKDEKLKKNLYQDLFCLVDLVNDKEKCLKVAEKWQIIA